MTLRDYFFGQHIVLRSPLRPSAIAKRINEQAGSPLWPFNVGVVGRSWWGRLRLRYSSSPMQYNAKPLLSGRIEDAPLGSTLRLAYRGPLTMLPLLLIWYGFLSYITAMLIRYGFGPADDESSPVFAVVILTTMWLAPAVMHLIGTRNADEELTELLDFLENTVEAKPNSLIHGTSLH
jgi:hypothetical protein